ncbi:MAG TPA: hypothetical protein PKI60_00700 [Oscillospiraceae bacterium]|mgnify:CR=1 FL=1|nr:hypothetical protein [Oscillospiraceae bacterium]
MKKLIPIILALIILSGCTSAGKAAESGVTESTTTKAETTTEIQTTTEAVTTTPGSVETLTEPEMNFVEVSDGNEFIDFDYIKDYKGTTDIGDLAEKAIQALKESDYYTNSIANKENFIGEEFTQYFDENGNIKPIFNRAFVEDFDGDGKTETFLLIDMPYLYYENYALTRNFMVYISSDNKAEFLESYYDIYEISLLNYGKTKQLIVASRGDCGADAKTLLYGVKNGKSVYLYGFRGGFYKSDCFLSGFGWQSSGDFMYFDTVALEYRIIVGEKLDIDEVLAMDKTNSLADLVLSPIWDKKWSKVYYIGNKYYCFVTGCMDTGTIYTYDNGKFILVENSEIRISENFFDMNAVKNIDINKAVSEMKKPKG